MKNLLANTHVSPETAYTVESYPYGFKLRCQKRYWLECHPKRGARLVTQTTNPKKVGVVWNAPKASTYCLFGGAMYLDDDDHVQWAGLTEYTNGTEATAFRDTYGPAVPEALQPVMNAWVAAKVAYDEKTAAGSDMRTAGAAATIVFGKNLAVGHAVEDAAREE